MTIYKKTNIIRVLETDNFIVEYDTRKKTYRVSYFDDNCNYQDEVSFEAVKENEVAE